MGIQLLCARLDAAETEMGKKILDLGCVAVIETRFEDEGCKAEGGVTCS